MVFATYAPKLGRIDSQDGEQTAALHPKIVSAWVEFGDQLDEWRAHHPDNIVQSIIPCFMVSFQIHYDHDPDTISDPLLSLPDTFT